MGRVRFPQKSLTAGEKVEKHLHPHWRTLVAPATWAVGIVVTAVAGLTVLPDGPLGQVLRILLTAGALLMFVLFAVWPALVSRTTHIVITNKRILLRKGVGGVHQRDVPLVLVNEVKIDQTWIDRILGCGTLVIGPASGPEQSRLVDIPDVHEVEVRINELIRGTGHERGTDLPDLEMRLREGRRASTS